MLTAWGANTQSLPRCHDDPTPRKLNVWSKVSNKMATLLLWQLHCHRERASSVTMETTFAQTMKLHASTRVGRLKERRVNLPLVIATSRLRDHQNTAAAIRDSRTKGVKPFPMKITIKAHKTHSHGMNQQGNKAQKITAWCWQSLMTALQNPHT